MSKIILIQGRNYGKVDLKVLFNFESPWFSEAATEDVARIAQSDFLSDCDKRLKAY